MHEFEYFVESTQRAVDLQDLGNLFLSELSREGFENFAIAKVSAFKLKDVPLFQFPTGYLDYYRDQKWDSLDPVINLSVRASQPFYWSDALPRSLTKKQKDFMCECREIGVHSGVTIPFHGAGNRTDLISMSRRSRGSQDRSRLLHLYAISGQVWQRALDFEKKINPDMSLPIPKLSPRELECLAWSRDGAGYHEIADKLHISHRTVEYHMSNAIRKLGARDKVTVIIKAIHYGLI